MRVGWPADRISFTGPAKLPSDLEASITNGISDVILESVREARLLSAAAGRAGPFAGYRRLVAMGGCLARGQGS